MYRTNDGKLAFFFIISVVEQYIRFDIWQGLDYNLITDRFVWIIRELRFIWQNTFCSNFLRYDSCTAVHTTIILVTYKKKFSKIWYTVTLKYSFILLKSRTPAFKFCLFLIRYKCVHITNVVESAITLARRYYK